MVMKDLIDIEEHERNRYQAALHGHDIDGGSIANPDDPTQGEGTPAWQESQRMALELNAKNRRN